ncbi:hypothetical protein TGRUB_278450 [Toxoplasma gondii RUB]|uniref:Uncharacterized protein n=2 Tax=Toxoplasma gondii TaxID=5811 RepID=A0A086LPJ4_TOXGO|nr:hypothetical protein TGRUB_278450 [Toxoplasma gondii RUB]KFH09295.1 hypothetical protein TGVAND_278450 [Toxoplasma gondii VAND]
MESLRGGGRLPPPPVTLLPLLVNDYIETLPNILSVQGAVKGLERTLTRTSGQIRTQFLTKPPLPDSLEQESQDETKRAATSKATSASTSPLEQRIDVPDPMNQPALEDPLGKYTRIRRPVSSVLRLLDYFQKYADVYVAWDWEMLADGIPVEQAYQIGATDFSAMLPDLICLHNELLKINLANARTLMRLQQQVAGDIGHKGPTTKALEKLFNDSMETLEESVKLQTHFEDYGPSLLADLSLGDRTKYLLYDPTRQRLIFDTRAYMKRVIPDDFESEAAAEELDQRIASLCSDGILKAYNQGVLPSGRRNLSNVSACPARHVRAEGAVAPSTIETRGEYQESRPLGASAAAAVGAHPVHVLPSDGPRAVSRSRSGAGVLENFAEQENRLSVPSTSPHRPIRRNCLRRTQPKQESVPASVSSAAGPTEIHEPLSEITKTTVNCEKPIRSRGAGSLVPPLAMSKLVR